MPCNVDQYMFSLPKHPRSAPSFWWRSCCTFFDFLAYCVLLFVWLSFPFWGMALSIGFRFMSLIVHMVSYASLLRFFLVVICTPYCKFMVSVYYFTFYFAGIYQPMHNIYDRKPELYTKDLVATLGKMYKFI